MPNHLINETSPYLLQHAENPVDWYPWGEEALGKARREDKPLFVSIGYAACHWCHVMEHESFENPSTAEILNRFFVSIKVDREERPDIDLIYMQAVVNMTGQGGWPLNVFLTPEGRPFYGGTYFPPTRRYGMPSFPEVLNTLAQTWNEDRQKVTNVSNQVFEQIQAELYWSIDAKQKALNKDILAAAAVDLLQNYDWDHGGWGNAPKFPAPMAVDFLFTQAKRGNQKAQEAAMHALNAMLQGGMYDLVGGGFHRYSTDETWLVPHFEKMLYDNAQLALAYLHAFQISADSRYRRVVEATLDFILRELTDREGGFFSSLDADSENEEGKFYTWTVDELRNAVSTQADFALFEKVFDLPTSGNFEGKIILRFAGEIEAICGMTGFSPTELEPKIDRWRLTLLERRNKRVHPGTDDKVLVAWNALALQAFAEAGAILGRPDYLDAARKNARFILSNLVQDGRLFRSWRSGKTGQNGTLEDYAGLILALLALYQADFDLEWFAAAQNLGDEMLRLFKDPSGGFYLVRAEQNDLALRPKDLQDNATPSANAQAIFALLQLSAFSGRGDLFATAEDALIQVQEILARYPTSFPFWLKALDFALGPVHQFAVVYPEGNNQKEGILSEVKAGFHPRTILAAGQDPVQNGSPEILRDRPVRDGKPTVYICHGFVCDQPLTDPIEIKSTLQQLD